MSKYKIDIECEKQSMTKVYVQKKRDGLNLFVENARK